MRREGHIEDSGRFPGLVADKIIRRRAKKSKKNRDYELLQKEDQGKHRTEIIDSYIMGTKESTCNDVIHSYRRSNSNLMKL